MWYTYINKFISILFIWIFKFFKWYSYW